MNINKTSLVVTAPNRSTQSGNTTLFLAGGISNCPDWQSEVINNLLKFESLTIFNPRRPLYPMNNPEKEYEQIKWEYDHLKSSAILVFWFSPGSLNPIALYELGLWVNARPETTAFIGVDPLYERKRDVIIQTKLARPDIVIAHSLTELTNQIGNYLLKRSG